MTTTKKEFVFADILNRLNNVIAYDAAASGMLDLIVGPTGAQMTNALVFVNYAPDDAIDVFNTAYTDAIAKLDKIDAMDDRVRDVTIEVAESIKKAFPLLPENPAQGIATIIMTMATNQQAEKLGISVVDDFKVRRDSVAELFSTGKHSSDD